MEHECFKIWTYINLPVEIGQLDKLKIVNLLMIVFCRNQIFVLFLIINWL